MVNDLYLPEGLQHIAHLSINTCNSSDLHMRRKRLKMLTDGSTDDRQKVITIAHPEHSSGELKTVLR